jgi:hypothetical protein
MAAPGIPNAQSMPSRSITRTPASIAVILAILNSLTLGLGNGGPQLAVQLRIKHMNIRTARLILKGLFHRVTLRS